MQQNGRLDTIETAEKMDAGEETGEVQLIVFPPDGTIYFAAYHGDLEALNNFIITQEVPPNATDESGRNPLIYSCMEDQERCADLLIEAGSDVYLYDSLGMCAIHWASQCGSVKCLRLLIQKGVNPTMKDLSGRTPLMLASTAKGTQCVSLLLKSLNKAQLNDTDNEGMTALHWSAYNNTTDCLKAIVKAGADIVVCDKGGKTVLHWTANNASTTTAKAILESAPSIVNLQDTEGRTAIHHAVASNNQPVIAVIVSTPGVYCNVSAVDFSFRTPLHWAAVLGFDSIVQYLLEVGANPTAADGEGALPLHYAAQRNNIDSVRMLMQVCDVNTINNEGHTPLMLAGMQGHHEVARRLLENRADPLIYDKSGSTVLHIAAACGYVDCMHAILQHSTSVNVLNADQHSPIFAACQQGHIDIVMALMQEGAAIDIADSEKRTPLHWAASGGHSYICSMLVQNGCPVDCEDENNRTPLHCAAYSGYAECIEILLQLGSDGNKLDKEGVSALHWACTAGSYEAVHILVQAGVFLNPMEVAGDRLTPLDYAIISGHQSIAQFLIDQGALSISGIQELAATSIQRLFRGYLGRKMAAKLRAEKSGLEEDRTSVGLSKAETEGSLGELEAVLKVDRSKEVKARLDSTSHEVSGISGKHVALGQFKVGDMGKDEAARKEKSRMLAYREKQKAALIIQLAWRKYVQRKRKEEAMKKRVQQVAFQVGSEDWRRELAALVIQLAWRQYLRRKLLTERIQRQKILHEWSPAVLAARQRALMERIYSQECKVSQYFPSKPKPMVRPAYMKYLPSPAALSFNFAITQYQPNLYS